MMEQSMVRTVHSASAERSTARGVRALAPTGAHLEWKRRREPAMTVRRARSCAGHVQATQWRKTRRNRACAATDSHGAPNSRRARAYTPCTSEASTAAELSPSARGRRANARVPSHGRDRRCMYSWSPPVWYRRLAAASLAKDALDSGTTELLRCESPRGMGGRQRQRQPED